VKRRKRPIGTRRGYVLLDEYGQPLAGDGTIHVLGKQRMAIASGQRYLRCWIVFEQPAGFVTTEWANRGIYGRRRGRAAA
jgi:hypothetical protein